MNKVWAFIISKELSDLELNNILDKGTTFVSGWTAHEKKLSGNFEIYKKRIILIKLNEDETNASGCSIDKLMRFIKDTESQFNIELLNRFLIAYQFGEDLKVIQANSVKELLKQGLISENTIVLNTSIANESELMVWEQPLKNTWLNKYLVKA